MGVILHSHLSEVFRGLTAINSNVWIARLEVHLVDPLMLFLTRRMKELSEDEEKLIRELRLGNLLRAVQVFDDLIMYQLLGLNRLSPSLCEQLPDHADDESDHEILPNG